MDIKGVIKTHGLTVKEVAERMGITSVGLSQHINGNPSVEVLHRIASAIGCEVGEFFGNKANFTAFIDYRGELHRFDTLEGLKKFISDAEDLQ